jgi:hypothetical protein
MRIFSVVLVALISIPLLASAAPNSVITGPYNVSFDVGLTKAAYNVTVNDPKDKEYYAGIYSISIDQDAVKRYAKILINDDGTTPSAALSSIFNIQNINTSEKEIDGINGTLTTGDVSFLGSKIPYYEASYYPFKDTAVLMISTFPEKNTLKLLDSIHIEMINTSSKTVVTQPTAAPAQEDPVAKLKQLKDMLDANLITKDEYDKTKAAILGRM